MLKTVTSLLLGSLLSQVVQAQSCGAEVTTEDLKVIQDLRNNSVDSRDFGDGPIQVAYQKLMKDQRSIPCLATKR